MMVNVIRNADAPPAGLAYAPPRLTVYGSVLELTASGTQDGCENGNTRNSGGNCPSTPNPNPRPRSRP